MANEFRVKNGLIVGSLSVDSGGTLTIPDEIIHAGDTNNKVGFGTDTQTFTTGGSSRMDVSNSGVRLGGANSRVTTILDENDMSTDSATALATQQSIKAYTDTKSVIAGNTSLVTTGTITTGVWQGTVVAAAYLPDASVTAQGVVELATSAETITGTDAARVVTPDGLADWTGGNSAVTKVGTIATGVWNGTVIANAYLDADTAHLSTTQTFSGAKTFSATVAVAGDIVHVGDTNNKIGFGTDIQTFTTAGTARLKIGADGRVGIGTTAPDAKLHVEGSVIIDSYNLKTTLATNYVDGQTALVLTNSSGFQSVGSGTIAGVAFTWSANDVATNTLTVPDLDAAYTAGSTLHVVPDAGIFFREGHESIGQPSITTFDGSNSGASPDGLSINAYDDIRFIMNSSEKMRLLTDGKFGIGTSAPETLLNIDNGTLQIGLQADDYFTALGNNSLQFNRASTSYIDQTVDNGDISFRMGSSSTNLLWLDGAGKVGIGNTSPDAKLDVDEVADGIGLRVRRNDSTTSDPLVKFIDDSGHQY
jgi:hypothetical protein